MSFARRHNKVNKWNIDTTNFEYKKIKDIVAADGEDVTYNVYGVTISRGGKYGDSASVILESCFVNLPPQSFIISLLPLPGLRAAELLLIPAICLLLQLHCPVQLHWLFELCRPLRLHWLF